VLCNKRSCVVVSTYVYNLYTFLGGLVDEILHMPLFFLCFLDNEHGTFRSRTLLAFLVSQFGFSFVEFPERIARIRCTRNETPALVIPKSFATRLPSIASGIFSANLTRRK
jgi:hypothetical protein